jgi:anti-sigma B factor antagonist
MTETPFRPFAIEVRPDRDRVHVAPAGDIDLLTAPQVENRVTELARAGFRRVVVDLRAVEFIDSTGLRLLLTLDEQSRADGWALSIVQGPANVRRLFEITGTLDALPFDDAV